MVLKGNAMAKTELFWSPSGSREKPFRAWLARHSEDGFLLNCYRTGEKRDDYTAYMLHRASCPAFSGNNPRTGKNWTNKRFCKVCSLDADALQALAKATGKRVPRCALCM